MARKNSLKMNAFFYTLYQIVLFVAPLIVLPFLTRTLGDTALGHYSYTYSIAYFFIIFANMGISTYGQREIAFVSSDKDKLRKKFWSLFSVHLFFSVLSSAIYFVMSIVFFADNSIFSLAILPYVLSAIFDITWLFYGVENFRTVALFNCVFAIIKTILIFILIKTSDDLIKYQIISFATTFVSQLTLFFIGIRTVGKPSKPNFKECLSHLKPLLYFGLSVVSISLYTMFDKTILGIFGFTQNVAYYDCADKIVAVPRTIITVVSTVLFPKICSLYAEKGGEQYIKKYTELSIELVSMISMGSIFGLLAIGLPFSMFYYGENFSTTGYAIMAMSPLIYIISIGSICRTQYILPKKKDNVFLISVSINAIVNIVVSLCLVPFLHIWGVIIGSLVSEITGMCFQLVYCRKDIQVRSLYKKIVPYLLFGLFMFMFLKGLEKLVPVNSIPNLFVHFILGFIVYMSCSLLYVMYKKRENAKENRLH